MSASGIRNVVRAGRRAIVAGLVVGLLVLAVPPRTDVLAAAGGQFTTPQAMLNALRDAGQSATQIATQLRQAFNQDAQQVASLLKSAGFTPEQVAAAIQSAFNANGQAVAQAMKNAGYTIDQIVSAIQSSVKATGAQLAQWLKAVGFTANQIATALKNTVNATLANAVTWLKNAGFTAAQTAVAIMQAYAPTPQNLAAALRAAGYTLIQVADALEAVDVQPGQIAAALRTAFNATAEQIAEIMKEQNAQVGQVLAALRDLYGYNTCGVAGCPAANLLRMVGYTAGQVTSALRQSYSLTADVAAGILQSVYGLSGAALQAALQAAGYTTAQIAAALAAATDAASSAGAGAVEVVGVVHSVQRSCSFPSGRLFGVGGTSPVPLPASRTQFTVTIAGRQLALVTDITGWPAAARATIRERHNCYLLVDILLPIGTREGTQGQATLRVGRSAGPRVAWAVGPIPAESRSGSAVISSGGGASRAPVGSGPAAGAPLPDLVASFSGQLLRFLQPNSRRINEQFCQTLPNPPAGQAAIGEVAVGNISWGVINSSNASVTTSFRMELGTTSPQGVLQSADVPQNTLVPGTPAVQRQYVRPQSRTRVIRVTPVSSAAVRTQYGGTGCFQLMMTQNDPFNWQDPSFSVRVDTTNAVNEGQGGELNNMTVY